MVKQIFPFIAFVLLLSSCSTFKPLNFTSDKQDGSPSASQAKFIEEINVTPDIPAIPKIVKPKPFAAIKDLFIDAKPVLKQESNDISRIIASRSAEVENASLVQLKYAVLMNTEVEALPSKSLLESVDEWYGVRYRTGGTTKSGVDCSGFTVAVYSAAFGVMLPRVSRDQYKASRKISTTELQEGDLVFFNTNGRGVSHVGVYLGNNKFIHASVSRGVMVNDLFEPYYLKRYIGGGRIEDKGSVTVN